MKANVKWINGLTFLANSDSGHGVVIDAPTDKGGNNLGASPMELLLMGVGSCTGIDVISILKKAQQTVTGLEIKVDSIRCEDDPKVFTEIKIIYLFSGQNLSRHHVERAVKMSANKYCCVSIMLGKTANITHEIILNDEVITLEHLSQ